MQKTILLCFIHGFKGGDDTFGTFPSHLKALLQHALPKVTVLTITYPKYETRGDLHECVGRFKEWLQDKVIDLEVANATPSPTVDPSVRTILVGHSMGGIVAAETLRRILAEQPVPSLQRSQTDAETAPQGLAEGSTLMFPYIQGLLAFDTPFLGIAPGVVAHGAEKHWNTASSAYAAYSNVAGAFGWGSKDTPTAAVDPSRRLPAPTSSADAASAPLWQRYGRVAMFAGAAGAIAAGGAAAYMKKDQISQGVTWATSHLEFVGSLARPEELKTRLASVIQLSRAHGLGFANIHTTLGRAVDAQKRESWTGAVAGRDRTFCNLPTGSAREFFVPAGNDKLEAETLAHMAMFNPRSNPGYYTLSETAKELVSDWVLGAWYEDSEGRVPGECEGEAELVMKPCDDEVLGVQDLDEGFEHVKRAES
ncbi:uncharacterized protein M421DRAFT_175684 [Didymella exigua CBS 183.55]|uniref:AB hydrolase-1 domain-containing protein n=1 Tax=Didymella exigua CBS 183.55 TaxID=1150837 RepID=A0A6A5RKJ0_9PLEO|nr:uncharacterized protein M421DRAFT_175684 [Didymella exigua CBS 183.55]KAF1927800.1 hypothetical protein M421DRAFT_175684 [Didymella exigua CBS 183.55]